MSYQRGIFISLLALVPLAAIGVSVILGYLEKYNKIVLIIFIPLVLIFTFHNYGNSTEGTEIYHLIDEDDYRAIQFLNTLNKTSIISDPEKTLPIIVMTNHHAIAGIAFIGTEQQRNITNEFFNSDCETKQEILNKNKYIQLVYTKDKIECDNLNLSEIYSEGVFIYQINSS